jgi:hypothetical protein
MAIAIEKIEIAANRIRLFCDLSNKLKLFLSPLLIITMFGGL